MPSSSTYFEVRWPWSAAGEAVEAWQTWAPQATDAVTSILHVESAGPRIFANGQYIGQSGQLPAVVKPLLEVTGARLAVNTERPYMEVQLLLADCEGRTVAACHTVGAGPGGVMPRETFNAKSDYVARPLPAAGRAAMIAAAEHPGAGDLLCDAYGGAISRVAPTATAFVHRDPLFCIQYYGAGASAAVDRAGLAEAASVRLGHGLSELHRSDAQWLATRLLRPESRPSRGDPGASRPRSRLRFRAGDRALSVGGSEFSRTHAG